MIASRSPFYALQPTIPHLTRSPPHRCLQRHDISRSPALEGEAAEKKRFKAYPIGFGWPMIPRIIV